MTEALLQYSSELSNSRITAATRVRYVNKQLKIVQCFIDNYPNLVDQTVDPPNLRLEAISPVVVGAILAFL
jgi:conjugal transfer/entry exclusion protein